LSSAEIMDEVIEAQRQAEANGTLNAGGRPSVRDIFEGVYAEMTPHIRRQRQKAGY
ncbi:3-methyl-2-oxobutanoate dehydrogenase (2-methylpropanoyl-transferring) subunit alpha, partial [Rhizobium johnstonii]